MKKVRTLSIFNLIALLLHIATSAATQLKLVNTKDVAEVSNLFPTLFTPAGFTFSIWGVIYIVLGTMCIYHIFIAFKRPLDHEGNQAINKMGWLFILNNLATVAWLYAWTHEQIGTAQILIMFQLISLIAIHSRLGIQEPYHSIPNKIFTQAPLSIYLGWISIATIANTAVYLTSIKWNGWGISPEFWALIMIAVAVLITILMIFFRNNAVFGLVVLWALAGIFFRQHQSYYPSIDKTALISIAITGAAILIQVFRMRHYQPPGIPHTV